MAHIAPDFGARPFAARGKLGTAFRTPSDEDQARPIGIWFLLPSQRVQGRVENALMASRGRSRPSRDFFCKGAPQTLGPPPGPSGSRTTERHRRLPAPGERKCTRGPSRRAGRAKLGHVTSGQGGDMGRFIRTAGKRRFLEPILLAAVFSHGGS